MARVVNARLRRVERVLGDDLERLRMDTSATKADIARIAGVDRTFYGRIEAGMAHPSLESLVAIATAMGAEVSLRLYAGRGPRLTDRHAARMIETTVRQLAPVWRPHLEVHVTRPVRGFIDAVFERRDQSLFVVAEFESMLPRLEQQIRWAGEKVTAIASSDVIPPGPSPQISRLIDRTHPLPRTRVRSDTSYRVPGFDEGGGRLLADRQPMARRCDRLDTDRGRDGRTTRRTAAWCPRWPVRQPTSERPRSRS
jgi:DNA-binding XRE family transcriptional regulator